MRFITALIAMAIAVTITTGGVTETWVLPDDPNLNWVRTTTTVAERVELPADPLEVYMAAVTTTTEAPVTTTTVVHVEHTVAPVERACLVVPIHVDDEGFLYLGPESERSFTGGLTMSDIRVSMVGHFLNIAFGYIVAVDPGDMELSSIDATGLTEVTICE